MSILDLDVLSPSDLVAQYVVECRGSGHFLAYLDYQVIDEWLQATKEPDQLLLILSEILPGHFSKAPAGKLRGLGATRKRVLRRLQEHAMRR